MFVTALRKTFWRMSRIFKPKRIRKAGFVRRVVLLFFFLLPLCLEGWVVFCCWLHCNARKCLDKRRNWLCNNLAPQH